MITQVCAQSLHEQGRELYLTNDGVATATQKAAHATRRVAVVHDQGASRRVAQETATVLRLAHLIDLLGSEPVLARQSRPKVLLSSSLRVSPSPLSQTLVPPLAVGLSVVTIAATRAIAALAPAQPPFGERFVRQVARALAAVGHASIMPRDTNTQALDQPCHADVLLELANRVDR